MDLGSILASSTQYKVVTTIFSVNATVQKAIGANGNRVAIMFCDPTGGVLIAANPANVGSLLGEISMTTTNENWRGTFWELGPYIQSAFFVTRASGTSNLGITEIIYVPTGG